MNGLYLQYEELWKVKYRKRWKEGEHCWQKSSEICDCSIPSWNFKDILSMVVTMEEYLSREEEIIVRNWKKKVKTKKLSKITNYIRRTRALSTVSARQNQSSACLRSQNYYLRNQQNLDTHRPLHHLYLKINCGRWVPC